MSQKGIYNFFAQDLPEKERGIIFATQTPWAIKATSTKISTAAWKNKPSWAIIGTEDHMVTPPLARAEAKMINAKVTELKSSHVPMVSMPKQVADVILGAAKTL